MESGAKRTLADQLGVELPAGIDGLPDEKKQLLADALRVARRHQASELAKASEESLKYVPSLLRPAVRKAVGL